MRKPRPRWDALSADRRAHDVRPGECGSILDRSSDKDAVVEAGSARVEAFEVIEGREVSGGVGEGDEFTVDGVPVSGRRGVEGTGGHVGGVTGLGGGVGERVGGTVGEYGFVRYFEGRVCAKIIQMADNRRGLDVDGVSAEAVVVREAPFQGSVDE